MIDVVAPDANGAPLPPMESAMYIRRSCTCLACIDYDDGACPYDDAPDDVGGIDSAELLAVDLMHGTAWSWCADDDVGEYDDVRQP